MLDLGKKPVFMLPVPPLKPLPLASQLKVVAGRCVYCMGPSLFRSELSGGTC